MTCTGVPGTVRVFVAPVVLLSYSVGGTPEAKDLFGLFDDTINRLLAALK